MTRSRVTSGLVTALLLSAATAAGQDEKLPEDLLIKLERTACEGSCPVYSVTIDAIGHVTYEGFRFVRVAGKQRDRIRRGDRVARSGPGEAKRTLTP